ncbi:MAG: S1/P1 nuclease [Saccharospirillaceae bacterium]|nr:S1/P1 nuclease [Pseudomonadales bacterium]NRB81138.1 S1/P1 nuclease [Saccharospirillaceae bacterium]
MKITQVCYFCIVLILPFASYGYDADGHRIIAQISLSYLSKDAKKRLSGIFGENYQQLFLEAPDYIKIKEQNLDSKWMKNLHFVFFKQGDEVFIPEQHCPNNQCSVAAVLESRVILQKAKYSLTQKRQALRYMVYYIGDIHMPMNNGFLVDRSGNKIQLQKNDLSYVSLNWAWNKGLMIEKQQKWFALSGAYRRGIEREQIQLWNQKKEPVEWVMESHQIAKDIGYNLAQSKKYDSAFIKKAMPIYDEQLKKAAVRLSTMLNQLYSAVD